MEVQLDLLLWHGYALKPRQQLRLESCPSQVNHFQQLDAVILSCHLNHSACWLLTPLNRPQFSRSCKTFVFTTLQSEIFITLLYPFLVTHLNSKYTISHIFGTHCLELLSRSSSRSLLHISWALTSQVS